MTKMKRGLIAIFVLCLLLTGIWLAIALPQLLDRLMTYDESKKIKTMQGNDSRRYAKVQGICPEDDEQA